MRRSFHYDIESNIDVAREIFPCARSESRVFAKKMSSAHQESTTSDVIEHSKYLSIVGG